MTKRIGGIITLYHASLRVRPSNWDQYSRIDSDSPWTSLNNERREVKTLETVSGQQCCMRVASIFEAPTMELALFVLEEKMETTVSNCKTQLPFPHPTCLLIAKIGGQGCICVACGEFRHTEIKLDSLQRVKKRFCVFNRVKLEELSMNSERSKVRNRRSNRDHGRRSPRNSRRRSHRNHHRRSRQQSRRKSWKNGRKPPRNRGYHTRSRRNRRELPRGGGHHMRKPLMSYRNTRRDGGGRNSWEVLIARTGGCTKVAPKHLSLSKRHPQV
jgi:hypothetical protein